MLGKPHDETGRRSPILQELRRNLRTAGIRVIPLEWRGTRLALLRRANPRGRPVLLLHGVTYSSASVFDLDVPGHDRSSYSTFMQLAARGMDCWSLDFAGYGFSETHVYNRMEMPGDYVAQVRDAADHVRSRTGKAPVLIGWSWGAQVASRAVAYHPEAFSGLVFWGGFWGGSGRLDQARKRALPTGERRCNTIEHAGADFLTPGNFRPEVKQAFVHHGLCLDPTSPTAGIVHSTLNLPLHDPGRIRRPTLVVHGSNDPVVDPDDIKDYAAGLGRNLAAHYCIPNADHNAQYSENRHMLFDCLADFALSLEPKKVMEHA